MAHKHRRKSSSSSDSESDAGSVATPVVLTPKLKADKKRQRDAVSSSDSDSSSSSGSERKKVKISKHRSPLEPESKKIKSKRDEVSPRAIVLPKVEDRPKDVSTNKKEEVTPSLLLAEVICDFADFASNLAHKISSKTGYPWTPRTEKEKKSKKIKDPNEPRRPQSSYTLWCEHTRKKIRERQPDRPPLRLSDLSEMWKNLPPQQKTKWELNARVEKDHYLKELEAYRASQAAADATPNGKAV